MNNIWSDELKDLEEYTLRIKGKINDLEKELTELSKASNDVTALLYARRSLETIVSEICVRQLNRDRGSEPLRGLIDKLNRDSFIPSYIHTAMINMNTLTSYGAHPKDFDTRQVRSALIDLSTIIEWYLEDRSILKMASTNETLSEKNQSKDTFKTIEAKQSRGISGNSNWKLWTWISFFAIALTGSILFYTNHKSGKESSSENGALSFLSNQDKAYVVATMMALSELGEKKDGYSSRDNQEFDKDSMLISDKIQNVSNSKIGSISITRIEKMKDYYKEVADKIKFPKINRFEPSTAIRLGVNPNSPRR